MRIVFYFITITNAAILIYVVYRLYYLMEAMDFIDNGIKVIYSTLKKQSLTNQDNHVNVYNKNHCKYYPDKCSFMKECSSDYKCTFCYSDDFTSICKIDINKKNV